MSKAINAKREIITSFFKHVVENVFRKMNEGGLNINSEDELKMELAHYLRTTKGLYEYSESSKIKIGIEKKIALSKKTAKTPSKDASIDLTITLDDVKCAIEVKYIAVKQKKDGRSNKINIEASGNNDHSRNRFDIYADLENLERYNKKEYDFGFMLFITNESDFHSNRVTGIAKNFTLVDGEKINQKSYKYSSKGKNGEQTVSLKNMYDLSWVTTKNFNYLLLEVD